MSFAQVAPKATGMPMLNGSAFTNIAAFEAIRRFDGDAKGIMFMPKETSSTPSSSISDAILSITLVIGVCHAHIYV